MRWKQRIGPGLPLVLLLVLLAGCGSRPKAVSETALPSPAPVMATASPTKPPVATRSTKGLPNAGALPEGSPVPPIYAVKKGDTLSGIARRFGCNLKNLIEDNDISDPNTLQVGQKLEMSACETETGPATRLLSDSEFVNGPAYVDFDVRSFVEAQGGYLAEYQEKIGGEILSGSEILSLIVHRYSVGPRMLLAILEMKSGWVTDPNPKGKALDFPMGYKGGGWELFYWQLAWAADELNRGYYDWRGRGMTPIVWRDGTVTQYAPTLNAGTAGLQYFLSRYADDEQWLTWLGEEPDGFAATYRRLFGDPEVYAIEPLISADTRQPPLSLPWPQDELWFYTSGPHGAWEEGSAWAALDFVPNEKGLGCRIASSHVTASAPGLIIYSQDGEVMLDLDGDGHVQTGWVLFYLHIATQDRVAVGTRVETGDPIGHPSCEGGLSDATHVHIARKFNGEWIAADGPLPFVLSGWEAQSTGRSYDGTLTKGKLVRTACECWDRDYNGIKANW